MGTNYYVETNYCNCCGRHDKLHIGKKSCGHPFVFYTGWSFKSAETWMLYLEQNRTIINEYGDLVTYEDFCEIVNESGSKCLAIEFS